MSAWWTFPTIAGGLGLCTWLYYCWARRRLDEWVRGNHLNLVRQQWRLFFRGPFDSVGKYTVFRIWVRDETQGERVGWVRLGGFFLGLGSDEAKVVWEWEKKESE